MVARTKIVEDGVVGETGIRSEEAYQYVGFRRCQTLSSANKNNLSSVRLMKLGHAK